MRIAALAAGLAAVLFLAACNGDDASPGTATPTGTATPAATGTPTATPTQPPAGSPTATPATGSPTATATPDSQPTDRELPADARTGIEGVDAVLAALFLQDEEALTSMLRYQDVECDADPPQGAGGPPECEEGEADGTEVSVFQAADCEGYWTRDGAMVVEAYLDQISRIYAVAEVREQTPGDTSEWSYGDHVIFTENEVTEGFERGAGIFVEEGEIVFIWFGCSQDLQQAMDDWGGEVLLEAEVM